MGKIEQYKEIAKKYDLSDKLSFHVVMPMKI